MVWWPPVRKTLSALTVAAASTGVFASPATQAKAFFESHEHFWTETPAPAMYSPAFERLLRLNSECVSAGESCAIDWDFWSSGQDRGELRLERVRRIASSPGKQIVEMLYRCNCGPGGLQRLTAQIVFVRIGRDWRIDDVRRGRNSTRKLMSNYFAAR